MNRAIFACFVITLSCAAQSTWPRADAASGRVDTNKLAGLESAVRSGEFKKIGSVLIARHGKLVYEKYFDGDASTQRDTRSATKSITSALVGIAIQEHRLSGVKAKILDILPEHTRRLQNPTVRKNEITVEDFLTMSSMLECDDWNDFSRGNEERMYLVEDWAQFVLDLPIRGRMRVGKNPEQPKYGRNFSYCTGGVFVLSEVLKRTTGMGADDYAQQKLFTPLGIAPENVTWVYSPLGIPQTGGGLRLTSPDLLKIAQMYLDGGKWNGKQIVAESWVRASTTPHAAINDHQEYGYLWWLQSFTRATDGRAFHAFFMSGNGGNKVLAFPELDMAVVITSTNYSTRGMHEQTDKLLTDYILPAVQ